MKAQIKTTFISYKGQSMPGYALIGVDRLGEKTIKELHKDFPFLKNEESISKQNTEFGFCIVFTRGWEIDTTGYTCKCCGVTYPSKERWGSTRKCKKCTEESIKDAISFIKEQKEKYGEGINEKNWRLHWLKNHGGVTPKQIEENNLISYC
jgi:hypothetical protein